METTLIILALIIVGYLIVYLVLKKKFETRLYTASILQELREEVNKIVVELNQTTERNIALIEDRIHHLSELLAQGDKKISLLKREVEKHEVSTKVYASLSKEEQISEPEPDGRKEVLRLHRSGFSSTMISQRTGVPLGEVELIISLRDRRESGEMR